MAVGFSNTIGTFKVDLDGIEINDEIEQYILDGIIDANYDEDGPDESFQINEIEPKYIEVKATNIFNKDYYSIEHRPIELVLRVKFEDAEDYYETDFYVSFKDLKMDYEFLPITDNWNSIVIDNYGEIETN